MLLSIDWDAFSGTRELVFDAPIWGTRDREHDRLGAWRERAGKRGGGGWASQDWANPGWAALDADFPLFPGWERLRAYVGVPAWITLSHADAWGWLERFPGGDVFNVDSHHDLTSLSGDGERLRPGNWAGLGLGAGLIRRYTCAYPAWHAGLPVAEGFDLARTWGELTPRLTPELAARVTLGRDLPWPEPSEVRALLLVQSPAWCNPAHDPALFALAGALGAVTLHPPLRRPWTE